MVPPASSRSAGILSDFSCFNNRQLRPMSVRSDMREALRMFTASVLRVRREYKRCLARGRRPQLVRLTIASQPIDVGNDATIRRADMLARNDSIVENAPLQGGINPAAKPTARRTTAKFVGSKLHEVTNDLDDELLDAEIEELFPMSVRYAAPRRAAHVGKLLNLDPRHSHALAIS